MPPANSAATTPPTMTSRPSVMATAIRSDPGARRGRRTGTAPAAGAPAEPDDAVELGLTEPGSCSIPVVAGPAATATTGAATATSFALATTTLFIRARMSARSVRAAANVASAATAASASPSASCRSPDASASRAFARCSSFWSGPAVFTVGARSAKRSPVRGRGRAWEMSSTALIVRKDLLISGRTLPRRRAARRRNAPELAVESAHNLGDIP